MAILVQASALNPPADRWVTIAAEEDEDVAEVMAELVYEGIPGYPGGVALGRVLQGPTTLGPSELSPDEMERAMREAGIPGEPAQYAVALHAAAVAELARRASG